MLDAPGGDAGNVAGMPFDIQGRVSLDSEVGGARDGLPEVLEAVVHVSVPGCVRVPLCGGRYTLHLPVVEADQVLPMRALGVSVRNFQLGEGRELTRQCSLCMRETT